MSTNLSHPEPEEPHLATAIARAERRRGKLECLSDLGMALAEQIGAHAAAAMAAVSEERGGDPARSFATVSRAVRMTLALEARFDDQILAMRRGELPAPRRVRAAPSEKDAQSEMVAAAPKLPDPRRERVDIAVREAIHLEVKSIDRARETLDALNERLFDTEAYDVLLDLPFRGVVAAICADLGLEPDWELWSEDIGFVAPPGRRRVDWTRLVASSFPPGKAPAAKPPPIHRRE